MPSSALRRACASESRTPVEPLRFPGAGDCAVKRGGRARLPTRHGEFTAIAYRSPRDGSEHLALVRGDPAAHKSVLGRVHSECLTGDVFGSLRCDCGQQLDAALERIAAEGAGVLIYLRNHEGRGIGLEAKLRAYALQDEGLDTVEANEKLGLPVDARSYESAAAILADLGLTTLRLLSNNPAKVAALQEHGVRVIERVPLVAPPTPENLAYVQTKQTKLGHLYGLTPTLLPGP